MKSFRYKHHPISAPLLRASMVMLVTFLLLGGVLWWRKGQMRPEIVATQADSAALDSFSVRHKRYKQEAEGRFRAQFGRNEAVFPLEPTPFDPNTADSLTLLHHALPPFVVFRTLRYRAKGGRWRSPEKYAAFTQLSDAQIRPIFPYIQIADAPYAEHHNSYWREADSARVRQEKFAEGTTIDLNAADTTLLKHIPGIASGRARQIVSYRERLGGFTRVAQLQEIQGFPPELQTWFTLEAHPAVRKLQLNKATFQELVRHPYLDYEQTKKIMNFRRQHGAIPDLRALSFLLGVPESDLARLVPYLDF